MASLLTLASAYFDSENESKLRMLLVLRKMALTGRLIESTDDNGTSMNWVLFRAPLWVFKYITSMIDELPRWFQLKFSLRLELGRFNYGPCSDGSLVQKYKVVINEIVRQNMEFHINIPHELFLKILWQSISNEYDPR